MLNHINDTEYVETQRGCIVADDFVGDFFIRAATNRFGMVTYPLSTTQIKYLDSILIVTPHKLDAKSSALWRIKPSDGLYSKIKSLVIEGDNREAMVPLSKYRKEQDTLVIQSAWEKAGGSANYYFFIAVENFPHPAFFTRLKESLDTALKNNNIWYENREMYDAIAAYRDTVALTLLHKPFDVHDEELRKRHLTSLFYALKNTDDPIYDNLLWKLWKEENIIDYDVFKKLYGKRPLEAYSLMVANMVDAESFYTTLLRVEYPTFKKLTDTMMNIISAKDSALAFEIISSKIKSGSSSIFVEFAEKADQSGDHRYIELFKERLETESNPYIYLKAAKSLLLLKGIDAKPLIVQARLKNNHLNNGWGATALDKLLQ
ncbi:MAG TPA: hypothetical protein VEC12_07985 [Bacteroidia bacterium]|nr:hypothetical protein [Bacteroidia bacterium]